MVAIAITILQYVPPINDMAKKNLPEPLLEIIGENPMKILETGMEKVEEVWRDLSN